MKRSTFSRTAIACICLGLTGPLSAAELAANGTPAQPDAKASNAGVVLPGKPAEGCVADLRNFDDMMVKDGYWIGRGLGYQAGGVGYGSYHSSATTAPVTGGILYNDVRPGYEVRALFASANILARHGEQKSCEDTLATARGLYTIYVERQKNSGIPPVDAPNFEKQQIAAALPVADQAASFRSDELLSTEVRSPQDVPLGNIEDLIMSPQSGKIAYLVIGRGGFLGIDEKYVPVPWDDFKVTANGSLLVLDTSKAALDGAPMVEKNQFTAPGQFDQESQKVDAYWKTHVSVKASN